MAAASAQKDTASPPMTTRARHFHQWSIYLRSCWQVAKSEERFQLEARELALRSPLTGGDLFQAWEGHVAREKWVSWRALMYLDVLLRLQLISQNDILSTIVDNLKHVFVKERPDSALTTSNVETGVLEHLSAAMLQRIQANNGKSKKPSLQLALKLFELIAKFTGAAEARGEALKGSAFAFANALSSYLIAHVNDLSASGVLAQDNGKPPSILRKAFSKVVPRFIQVLESSGSPLKDSLTLLQQQSKLQEDIDDGVQPGAVELLDAVSFQQNVSEVPVVHARASLVAFLSALLTGRPKADDGNLRTFLNARYQSDTATLIVDLIVASFHALAAAVLERKDNQEVIVVHRSFLVNKLPLVLEDYSALLFGDKSMYECISEALKQVDDCYKETPIVQPGTDSDPKQRFLLASALVGLIQESQVPALLGYPPTQGVPSGGRYNKDELIKQCQADSKRIEQLIAEMVRLEGNTGPIARALLEYMYILCASHETITLKILCDSFMRRPVALNYMLLFAEPRILLQPLCQLLDNWPTVDPSAEQHPVYDEFGSILLFLQVCRFRYDLPLSAFGRESPDSFVLSFFRKGSLPKAADQLSDAEKTHLSGWIKGLFEGEGISDETMSNCPPKDFYMLVATLVDQSLIAFQSGMLSLETIKGGFEFLYEPWLLPSLVPVLSMLASRPFGPQAEMPQLDYVMPLLTLLVKPPKLAPEAAPLHQLVLLIIASPLSKSLAQMKKRRNDVSQVYELLARICKQPSPVTNAVLWSTYEKWLNIPNGGMGRTLAQAFEELMRFNTPTKERPPKISYDHRLVHHTVASMGIFQALKVLLDSAFKHLGNPKDQSLALDTLTGVISANGTDIVDGRVSLRDALATVLGEVHLLARNFPAAAEFIVRLNRRVEAHCAKPMEQPPVISTGQQNSDGSGAEGEAAATAAVLVAAQQHPQAGLDAAVASVTAMANESNASAAAAAAAVLGGHGDLMAGIEQAGGGVGAAGGATGAVGAGLGMGDEMYMGDVGDISVNDFMSDLDMLGGRSVDDIFAEL